MLMIYLWGIGLALIDDNDHAVLTRVNDSFTVLVFGIKMLALMGASPSVHKMTDFAKQPTAIPAPPAGQLVLNSSTEIRAIAFDTASAASARKSECSVL